MKSGYVALFIAKMKMLSIYRSDFILGIISSLIKATIGILFIDIIFFNFNDLAGVDKSLVQCIYFSILIVQSLMNLFFLGLIDFSGIYIRGGELEPILLKPVNKMAYIIIDNIDIREIPNLLINIMLYIISICSTTVDIWGIITLILGPIIALGTLVSMVLFIDCFSFRFRDTLMAAKFAVSLSDLCRYPLNIYRKEIQYLFSIFLPLGAMQLFNIKVITNAPLCLAISIGAMTTLLIMAISLFLYSFKWYESVGS